MADSYNGMDTSEFPQQNGQVSSSESFTANGGVQDKPESMEKGKQARPGDKIHASKGEDDKTKLFVGGLSWETNEDGLKKYFAQFGHVVDVEVKKNPDGKSRGFGFVLFGDQDSVQKVEKCTQHKLDNKQIDPKRAIAVSKPKKIFVGGISQDVSVQDIEEHFGKFGEITESEIPVNKETKKHKGYAFLVFEKDESVGNIVRDQYHYIGGKYKCEVKRALSKEEYQKQMGWMQGYPPYSPYPSSYSGYGQGGGTVTRARGRGYNAAYPQGYGYPQYNYYSGGYASGNANYDYNGGHNWHGYHGSGNNYYGYGSGYGYNEYNFNNQSSYGYQGSYGGGNYNNYGQGYGEKKQVDY